MTAICDECGLPLTVSGKAVDPDPFLDEPHHIFCDICGKQEHPADMDPDWNGETGSHRSCEAVEAIARPRTRPWTDDPDER